MATYCGMKWLYHVIYKCICATSLSAWPGPRSKKRRKGEHISQALRITRPWGRRWSLPDGHARLKRWTKWPRECLSSYSSAQCFTATHIFIKDLKD